MNPNSTFNSPVGLDELGSLESRMSRGVPAAIEEWNRACSSLCTWEHEHLDVDSSGEELAHHKHWLQDLLAWGTAICRETHKPDFADKPTADAVEQRMSHLDDKYAVWHGGMTSEDGARVLDAAFD
jgi:hypothetical protein